MVTIPDGYHALPAAGGVLPLAVTLASEAVFDAFKGEGKLDALLHGHSYTAHPIGCAAAAAALDAYSDPAANPNLCCPAVRLPWTRCQSRSIMN